MAPSRSPIVSLALCFAIPILWAPIPYLQRHIQQERRKSGAEKLELLYTHKLAITLGQDPLLADLYWIQTLRYVYRHLDDRNFFYLYSLLDKVTDLDPYFLRAYLYGSAFLTSVAAENQYAIQLLEKGWKNTGKWQIAIELGSVYQIYLKDQSSALFWYEQGAKDPESPDFYRRLVAALHAKEKGDEREELRIGAELALQRYREILKEASASPALVEARKNEAIQAVEKYLQRLERESPEHKDIQKYRKILRQILRLQ